MMPTRETHKVAILWQADRDMRKKAVVEKSRLNGIANALGQVGIEVEAAVYADEFMEEVRDQLLKLDGVLVWVNPVEKGSDRSVLDQMLGQVADQGIFVSAHPEIIQKMGTKEVLFKTRDIRWGCDTHLYTSLQQFHEQFPQRLAEGKPRVLKLNRGNGGDGVWKVEFVSSRNASVGTKLDLASLHDAPVFFRHARRGSIEEKLPLGEVLTQFEQHFTGSDQIVDQAYQERLSEGMVRCYLVGDKVVGFGEQLVNALYPASPDMPPEEAPQPGSRLYYPATRPDFQRLKKKLEEQWLPDMQQLLDIETESLPVIWDADFLYGPKDAAGEDTYVLCEINVSAVFPFPDEALAPLAQEMLKRIV